MNQLRWVHVKSLVDAKSFKLPMNDTSEGVFPGEVLGI